MRNGLLAASQHRTSVRIKVLELATEAMRERLQTASTEEYMEAIMTLARRMEVYVNASSKGGDK